MNIKISVIMPVYNMQEYIKNSIRSFINQTLVEKELIVVDDGSTDDSCKIAESYADKYHNITIVKQKNRGPGEARNTGIRKSEGEYICFLDADDFYASDDVLDYLYCLAKSKNVVICGGSSCDYVNGTVKVDGTRKERKFIKNQYFQKEDYPGIGGYWAFIFQRKFLLNNHINFPDYLNGEDSLFLVKAIGCAGRVYCSKKIVYVYRKQHKEVQFDEKRVVDAAKSYKDILEIAIKHNMKNVQHVINEELKGELGALLYSFSYNGSTEAMHLIKEINRFYNEKVLYEDLELRNYVEVSRKKGMEFVERLKQISRIYVFGAGLIGTKVANFLEKNQIEIRSFIVSNVEQNASFINGISVSGVKQIDMGDLNYIVIIATFWFSQEEIISLLKKEGVVNIYPLDICQFFLWQDRITH